MRSPSAAIQSRMAGGAVDAGALLVAGDGDAMLPVGGEAAMKSMAAAAKAATPDFMSAVPRP